MLSWLLAPLAALAPSGAGAPGVPGTAGGGSNLEKALDAIRAEDIRADIHFIASDELGGRDTPSPGLRVAARYIAARLERLGFRHGARDGWFHTYPLESRQIDEEASAVAIAGPGGETKLAFAADYFFQARDLARHEVSGAVVFCGRGEKEDFAEAVPEGRWALCADTGSSSRSRAKAAAEAGAIGLIVVPGPGYEGQPYVERFASDVARCRRAAVTWPARPRDEESAKGAEAPASGPRKKTFPQVYVADAARLGLAFGADGALPEVGRDLGLTVSETRRLAGEAGEIQVENVCGFWPGSDPELAKEVIILSAHYDHVGTNRGQVYNGADDNGSGTTGLLAIAAALKAHGPMRRSVLILWVSGEEKGLWGSQAWTEDPWLPEGCRPVCDVNIDMIGRNAPDYLLITPTREHHAYNGLTKLAEANAATEGFKPLGSADEYWHRSDQANFSQNLKIPVCFLFSDVHEDYHQPGDDPEKIDCDKIRRVTRLVVRMLDGLQTDALEL